MRTLRGLTLFSVVAVACMGVGGTARASHDWSHSYLIVENVGTTGDQDKGQAWTDSDSNNDQSVPYQADVIHARMQVKKASNGEIVGNKDATCGPINDNCRRVSTGYVFVAGNVTHDWVNWHCGHDNYNGNKHTFGTLQKFLHPCSAQQDLIDEHSPRV